MADPSTQRQARAIRFGATLERLASTRYALSAVIALGILVRLAADLVVGADVPQYEFGVIATNMNSGRGFSFFGTDESGRVIPGFTGTAVPSAFMPPLYTLLVTLAQYLTTDAQLTIRVLQGVNLLLAGILIYAFVHLVRILSQSHVGSLLAGLSVALYPTLVYSATQVSASNLYLPLEVALLGLLLVAARRLSSGRAVLLGLGLGVLTLLRAEAVALIPLLALWLWRFAPAADARRKAVQVLCMTLIAALLPLGWMVNSSLRLGAPVTSITTTAGFNLWIGNHEGASGSQKQVFLEGQGVPEAQRLEEAVAQLPPTNDHEVLRDDLYMAEALQYMKSQPVETLARNVKKLGLVVVGDLYDPRSGLLTIGLNLLVLAGGLWGAFGIRLRREAWILLGGYALTSVAVCFVFFTLERYTIPLKLVLLAFLAIRLATALSAPAARKPRA
jgi:hypothetical protein